MAYCINCGKELVIGANFCAFCGTKINSIPNVQANTRQQFQPYTQRQEEYVGKVFKCPNCGATINHSTARCPECNYEISGKAVNETISSFSKQLMELERQRGQEKTSIGQTITNAIFNPAANNRGSHIDARILTLIRSFPIPNSIEEISEFMYMAVGSIDVNLSRNTMFNNSPGGRMQGGIQREISDAWVAKLQQVYAKAERSFPNEPEFQQLRNIYLSKMKELKIKVK